MTMLNRLRGGYAFLAGFGDRLEPLALLIARLSVARVFFNSGQTKWNGFFDFNTDKYDLFLYEFFCPEEVRPGALVLCSNQAEGTYAPATQWIVERFANLAGVMEIVLPLLLVVGLFTRFAGLGLLAMALFISVAVFPDADSWWGSHVWWVAILMVIVARGPGFLSADRFLRLDARKSPDHAEA